MPHCLIFTHNHIHNLYNIIPQSPPLAKSCKVCRTEGLKTNIEKHIELLDVVSSSAVGRKRQF